MSSGLELSLPPDGYENVIFFFRKTLGGQCEGNGEGSGLGWGLKWKEQDPCLQVKEEEAEGTQAQPRGLGKRGTGVQPWVKVKLMEAGN